VAGVLAAEVEQGVVSGRLATERAMCERFGVSRVTLRRALATLADAGLVEPSWGRGWYVANKPLSEPPNALLSFTELAERRGLAPSTRVLDVGVRAATLDEAGLLHVAPGSPLVRLERLRFMESVPTVLQCSLLAVARLDGLPALLGSLDLSQSLYRLLEDRWGVAAARADYAVEARSATAREADLLQVAVGSPLLCATQVTFDQHDLPFEKHRSAYPYDRYRFEASLTRPSSTTATSRARAVRRHSHSSAGTQRPVRSQEER
jgi:GntR family transcriptional regulator